MKRIISGKAAALNTEPHLQPHTQTVLPTNENWLNTAQLMSHFNVSDRTLLRWRKARHIPYSKVSGTVFYPLNLLNKMMINKINPDLFK